MADVVERAIYSAEVRGKEQLDALAQSLDKVSTSEEKVTRATRTTMDGVERLIASYDKQTRLMNQYYAKMEQLDRLERENIGTAERRKVAYDLVTDSLNRQLAAIDGTAAKFDRLQAKFDPAGSSLKQMVAELRDLNEAQKLGVNIAGGYENAWNKIVAKYNESHQKTAQVKADQREMIEGAKRAQKEITDAQNAAAAQGAFNTQLGVGPRPGAPSRADWEEQFRGAQNVSSAADRATASLRTYNVQQAQTGVGSRQLGFLMTNLTFQINDIVTGLASGQSAFRVFAQQGGQVFQIFQLGGRDVFTALGNQIRALITPLNLFRGGLLAVVGVFALAINRAIELQAQLRQFNTALSGMGKEGQITAKGLETIVDNLREIGVSAKEAQDAVLLVARTPGINAARTQQLATLGADISAARGTTVPEGTKELLEAIRQTTPDAIAKLGIELNKLTQTEVNYIFRLKEQKGAVEAIDYAVNLLSGRLAGTYKNSLSEFAQEWAKVVLEFDKFLKALADTGLVQEALKTLRDTIREIKDLIEFINRNMPKGAAAATNQATINQAEMRAALAERSGLTGQALELQKLQPELADQLTKLFAMAAERGITLGIGSGYRDAETQADMRRKYEAALARGEHPAPVGTVESSMHVRGGAVDLKGASGTAVQFGTREDAFLREVLPKLGLGRPVPGEAWHVQLVGSSAGTAESAEAAAARARAATGVVAGGAAAASSTQMPQVTAELEKARIEGEKRLEITKAMGMAEVELRARLEARAQAEQLGIKGTDADKFVQEAVTRATQERTAEIEKAIKIKDMESQGEGKVLDAFKQSEAAGYREIAMLEARIQVATHGGNVEEEARVRLEASANAALRSGQQQVAAALPQVAMQEKLAAAAKNGAAAQHEAELQAQIAARTQDALAKAEASRNPALIAQAKALNDAASAEIRRADAAKLSLANTEAIRGERENQQVAALEIRLQGQTTEAIQTQVNLLRVKNELDKAGNSLTDQEKKDRVAAVTATGQMNEKLAEAQREQQRLEDGIRQIASAVENELTKSIENAFSGEKVESWGTRIKKMLGSLAAGISDALFIKPLLGSLASIVSPNLGAQMGTLGALGNLGNLFGGSSGTQTLTGTVGGQPATFSLGNVSSGLNILDKIGGELGIGGTSGTGGISGFFSGGLGGVFAHPGLLSTESATSLANMIGIESSTFNAIPGIVTTPGTLFGSATFGQALGGIGAGFGAGTLLNSLVGGNTTGGTIGSGIGSIAGFALGTAIGMPFLGALLGGAGGGLLGGLFGGKKPDMATAATIDLFSGKVGGYQSHGVAENDQRAQQLLQGITSFSESVKKLTGGTIEGSLTVAAGSRRGIVLSGNIGDIQGEAQFGQDAEKALSTAKLAILHQLTDISDTMKNIIGQVTDPDDADNAIRFASAYENLTKAFDNAFSSISTDAKVVGPFSVALEQLNITFKDLTENAIKYNVSLDPINAGQKESIKRLNEAYELFIKQQEVASTGDAEFLSPAFAAHQQFLQNVNDAKALGLDNPAMLTRITQIEQNTLKTILTPLTNAQIQIVIDAFSKIAPEVSDFAKTMLHTGDVIQQVTEDTDSLYKSLIDLRAQLTTGPSSGLTAAQQIEAAQENFARTLRLVQGGDKSQISVLATQGQNLINLSEQTYGNAPKTSAIRETILAGINAVLKGVSAAIQITGANDNSTPPIRAAFATGTRSTPPGTILVGENGPELITQPGGLRIWNSRETELLMSQGSNSELIGKLDLVISLLSGGNTIAREHGVISERGFAKLTGQVEEMQQPSFEPPARRNVA